MKDNISIFFRKKILPNWQIYVLLIVPVMYLIIFKYIPMAGILIAFKDYSPRLGMLGSEWVGGRYFNQFLQSPNFFLILKNTLGISLYSIVVGFPIPILLAILLNEVKSKWFKKIVQMVTYAPYFISTVILAAMLIDFLSIRGGIINQILQLFGAEEQNFIADPRKFKTIYVLAGVWSGTGYAAIIYLATLAGIDPTYYEAATIDGASRLQKIRYINIPSLMPTIVILLIMRVGQLMNVGHELILLLQNDLNSSSSEIISTYVYKVGLIGAEFSFSTAVGLFNSIINLVLLIGCNTLARKLIGTSLW